ncbi:MAG TPA: hypothetical protein VF210_05280 [Pseudomonadales bacterium]
MHCEEARTALLDGLDQPASAADAELERHLDGCADCRALREDIQAMRARARVWHDLEPPPRPAAPPDPARLVPPPGLGWRNLLQQWLPLAASSLALLLAVGAYRQNDAAAPNEAAPAVPAAGDPLLANPELLDSPAARAVLAASRRERQREMEALATLLKAELDRQKAQTEESLEYLLSYQIRSARELDALRGRLLQADLRATEAL